MAIVLMFILPMMPATASHLKLAVSEINSTESSNWAGYIAASSINNPTAEVTGITGSWIVQTANATSGCTYSAQWIGIGGFFSGDSSLIQAGTTSQYDCGASYSAWYEMLPAAETPISMSINPGDVVVVTIFLANAPNFWNIYINDTTQNEHFSTTVTYNSSMLSAEWIEERPEINGQLSCLADFGTAYFGSYFTGIPNTNYATINGITGPISSFSYESIDMTSNSGSIIAQPGSLINGGSFTMQYEGSSSNNCCCYCCF